MLQKSPTCALQPPQAGQEHGHARAASRPHICRVMGQLPHHPQKQQQAWLCKPVFASKKSYLLLCFFSFLFF